MHRDGAFVSIYLSISAAILCAVFLLKWARALLQNSIFYVTVRTRSSWPIFGAPWRECFSSVHWKPWLQHFITVSQRLQRIRRWSYEEHRLSACAGRGEELLLVSLAEHMAAWHCTWYGLNSCFVIPRCPVLQIPPNAVFPNYSGMLKMSCYTACRVAHSVCWTGLLLLLRMPWLHAFLHTSGFSCCSQTTSFLISLKSISHDPPLNV